MQIELIGCTSAGKSTLVRNILNACQDRGIDALTGDEFVLGQYQLNWVKNYLARTLLVDLFSLLACLLTWRNNFEFYLLTVQTVWRLPAKVALFEKLNIVRNVLKKIGIHEIIHRRGCERQIVLLDEGTLHTANYLFVNISGEPNTSDLSTFIGLVPLPDVAIYVQQDEAVLIARTLARGHKRIPEGSYTQAERFIKFTVAIFDKLVQASVIESRLLVVDKEQNIIPAPNYQKDPSLVIASKLLHGAIDAEIITAAKTQHFHTK